jgi:hypothetical protein
LAKATLIAAERAAIKAEADRKATILAEKQAAAIIAAGIASGALRPDGTPWRNGDVIGTHDDAGADRARW